MRFTLGLRVLRLLNGSQCLPFILGLDAKDRSSNPKILDLTRLFGSES